jgi:PAS domain S-box-containing protein
MVNKENLMERSPVPMAELEGPDHIMRYVNPSFCRLLGKSTAALTGKPFGETMQEKNGCLALLDRVYRTGEPETHTEAGHPEPDSPYWTYAIWPVLDAEQRPASVIMQVTETTQFHQQTGAMNEALLLSSLRQHALTEAAEKLSDQLGAEIVEHKRTEDALRAAEEQFRRSIEHAPIPVIMQAEDGQVIEISEAWSKLTGYTREEMNTLGAWLTRAYGPSADALREHVRGLFAGESSIERTEFEIRTHSGERRSWVFSAWPVGTLLDGRRYIVGTAFDITERKAAVEALRASEAQFAGIFDQVTGGIAQTDLSGRFLLVNDRYCQIVGRAREELLTLHMQEITHPEDLLPNDEQFRALAEGSGGNFVIEKRYLRPDGSAVWVHNEVSAIRDPAGHPRYLVAVVTEITERRQAEEALRESQSRFNIVKDATQVGFWFCDLPFDKLIWDNRVKEHFWLPPEAGATIGTFFETLHPADRERTRRAIDEAIANKTPYEIEYRTVAPDGEEKWIRAIGGAFYDAEDKPTRFDGVTMDITERKRVEQLLSASEERFRQFAENSTDVFWIIDGRTRRLEYLNPVYEEMFGESREPIMRDLGRWPELIHPDDREHGADMLERLLAGENVTVDYRIIRPNDGAIRWIRDSGFPIRDHNGAVTRLAGVLQDITEDKEQTEALYESEERFRLLVEGAPDYAMFLLDPANQIIYWSSGAELVFGWSANEVLGQSGELIFTPEDRVRKQEQSELRTALHKGVANDRRWHLRKDGSRIWIDGVIRRLDDESGNLRGFAKIARDTTELHQAEEELKASHHNLERRVRERTAELTALNQELQSEMKERAQVEQELLLVSEREKRRIGQDLHDSLCQELAAAALFLQTAAQKMEKKTPSGAKVLSQAAHIVNDNVGLARDLARGLHPVELTSSGLPNALRELAFRTSQVRSVTCHCECARQIGVRDEAVVLNLYRIAQEAVTNSVKNGKATVITIRLARDRNGLALTVKDNGKGFSLSKSHHGMGLHIMRYRADVIGARLTVESTDGKGTLVSCVLPVE